MNDCSPGGRKEGSLLEIIFSWPCKAIASVQTQAELVEGCKSVRINKVAGLSGKKKMLEKYLTICLVYLFNLLFTPLFSTSVLSFFDQFIIGVICIPVYLTF